MLIKWKTGDVLNCIDKNGNKWEDRAEYNEEAHIKSIMPLNGDIVTLKLLDESTLNIDKNKIEIIY